MARPECVVALWPAEATFDGVRRVFRAFPAEVSYAFVVALRGG